MWERRHSCSGGDLHDLKRQWTGTRSEHSEEGEWATVKSSKMDGLLDWRWGAASSVAAGGRRGLCPANGSASIPASGRHSLHHLRPPPWSHTA
jgi:hypothetical protein